MKKYCLVLVFCFAAGAGWLGAQAVSGGQSTAAEIETLLGTGAVTYAQAARFVLEASDTLATASYEEAFSYAVEQEWLPKNVSAGDTARLDNISLLFMRSFDVYGGIMYSFIQNPRYAYRELTYRGVIQGRADPAMNVSGERLLFITGRLLSMYGDASQESAADARRRRLAAFINLILGQQNVADTVAEVTDEGVMIRLSNIQFAADSTVLPQSERVKLQEIANILKTVPGRILVTGHTARAGTEESSLEISRGRARVVADYLVSLGARKADEIVAAGYGSQYPIADNATEAGMAANRRVEITILED